MLEHYLRTQNLICGLSVAATPEGLIRATAHPTNFKKNPLMCHSFRGFFYSNPARVATSTRNVVNGFGFRDGRSVNRCHRASLPAQARLSLIIGAVWRGSQSAVTPPVNHRGRKGHGYPIKAEGVKGRGRHLLRPIYLFGTESNVVDATLCPVITRIKTQQRHCHKVLKATSLCWSLSGYHTSSAGYTAKHAPKQKKRHCFSPNFYFGQSALVNVHFAKGWRFTDGAGGRFTPQKKYPVTNLLPKIPSSGLNVPVASMSLSGQRELITCDVLGQGIVQI